MLRKLNIVIHHLRSNVGEKTYMETIRISDKLFQLRNEPLKETSFVLRFIKNHFENMASLDQMYLLPVRVPGNGPSKSQFY